MKLTKKEIIEKYSSKFEDKDEQIAFLEDISDSIEVTDDSEKSAEIEKLNSEIERLKNDLDMQKQRYIDRFIEGEELEKKAEEFKEEIDEPEEKEVIDIKEI